MSKAATKQETDETVPDAAEEFLASKSGNSLGTVGTYRAYLSGYMKWKRGTTIDMKSYDRYILHLKGLHRRQNGVATASVVLREYAKFLNVNTTGWQKPRAQKVVTEYLRKNEMDMLHIAIQKTEHNERNLFIFDFLINTGMRVGELLKLKWSDMDLEGRDGGMVTCNIRQAKGNKSRTIRLSVGARRAAMRYARFLFGEKVKPEALRLNPDRVLDIGTKEAIEWMLTRVASLAGLDTIGLHPHMLRHTFGVMTTKKRVMSEKQLQTHMGHASIATTERYQQFADLDDSDAFAETDFSGGAQ